MPRWREIEGPGTKFGSIRDRRSISRGRLAPPIGVDKSAACQFSRPWRPGERGLTRLAQLLRHEGPIFIPAGGGTVRLPRLIGTARAKQLIMLGKAIDAKTAVRYGLVMQAVPPDQLMSAAMQLARRLAALSSTALGYIKSVINASVSMPLEDALALENHAFEVLVHTDEAQHLTQKYLQQGQRWGASQEGLPP